MFVPLEQRGSPVCSLLPALPAPCPANRIVSLGDKSAVVMPAQVVPSCSCLCVCGGRAALESQSSDDSVSRMTCPCPPPPPRWLPLSVSCRDCRDCRVCAGVSDSDEDRNRNCSCRVISARSWPARPRAQCSRKIVSDKGRKCRHTSCQSSVSNVDSVSQPATPVSVIDVLHRDQRTVCVSSNECSDFVPSAKDFECNAYRSRTCFRRCDLQIRFSMQRFCSAVLCGLLLLTALRPQFSMAAPVLSRDHIPSEDNHGSSSSATDVKETLKHLRLEVDLTLGHFNEKIRNQYCKDVFFVDKAGCPYYPIDIGAFKFIAVPKKLGERLGNEHFDTEEKVNEALQNTLHNFQAYPIHLQKLKENQIPDEKNFSNQYDVLKEHIRKLHEELLNLMKLRGVKPLAISTVTDIENLHNTDTSLARMIHWGILVEVINGVEYFEQLMPYLTPTRQSTKL